MSSYDKTFRILLLGDASVDKTSFAKQFCYNSFIPSERLTTGVDFHVKTIYLHGKKLKLQIWDVGGEERFKFLLPTYCLGANAAIIVFDVTRSQTLDVIEQWINVVRQKSGDIPIMLVGLLPDDKSEREVSTKEGKEIATRKNLNGYIECNVRTGENIKKVFENLTSLVLPKQKDNRILEKKLLKSKRRSKKKDYEEFMVFRPERTGDRTKLNIAPEELQKYLNPEQVLIILRNDLERIFIWKGVNSHVRKKFIATRVAAELQNDVVIDGHFHRCKIISVDQGEEPQEFLNAFILETMKVTERCRLSDEEIMVLDLESEEGIKLIKQYEEETYKYAIWRGEVTQGFNKWLKGEKVETMDARLLRERLEDQKSDQEFLKVNLNNIEHFLKSRTFNQNFTLELLAKMLLLYYKKHNKEFENFLENIKKWESFDENKFPYSEILLLFYGDDEYREDFLKEIRKGRFEGGDKYPYPYVFKPPEPPEDLAVAPRTQLRSSPRKKDREEEIYCQYCGKELTKEEQLTHSCKKKPEKN